jgi:hypothetical protein
LPRTAVEAFCGDAEDLPGFVEAADAAFLGQGFDLGCGDWAVAFIWREFARCLYRPPARPPFEPRIGSCPIQSFSIISISPRSPRKFE